MGENLKLVIDKTDEDIEFIKNILDNEKKEIGNMEYLKKKRIIQCILLEKIDGLVENSKRDKALLSFKYDLLTYKLNIVQISIIFVSVSISIIETVKLQYKINDDYISIISLVLSSYIAFILAIMRFLKWIDKNEEIVKTMENFSFIINKLKKSKFLIKNFCIELDNLEIWENIENTFKNETYDYLVTTRETYDNIMNYSEKLYFLEKYRKKFIEYKFKKKDLKMVDKFDYGLLDRKKYITNGKINYEKFCNYLSEKEKTQITFL